MWFARCDAITKKIRPENSIINFSATTFYLSKPQLVYAIHLNTFLIDLQS